MENKDKSVHRFKDWWHLYSDEIFEGLKVAEKEGAGYDWWSAFEKCWDASRSLETRRCAELSASRLALEAERETAYVNDKLKEFLDRDRPNYD